MSKYKTFVDILFHRPGMLVEAVFDNLCRNGVFNRLSDKAFLSLAYRIHLKEKLNLENPKTFNAKLQWLKINDHNPVYTSMVDKLQAKEYVKSVLGPEYVIPTLKVWDSPEQITTESLPSQFVIKTSNGSGGSDVIVCTDKASFNIKEVQHRMKKSLKKNVYKSLREWPYKSIQAKIFAEKFMADSGEELHDYKFFCFDGTVACFKVDFNRWSGHRANYYSPDLQLIPYGEVVCPPDFTQKPPIPDNINEMIKVAEKLSASFPFMRVDLYNIKGKIYFGEMTFYPASGFGPFTDKKFDYMLGYLLKVPFISDANTI